VGGAQIRVMRRVGFGRNVSLGEPEYAKIGARIYDFSDPYHLALTVGWGWFLGAVGLLYGAINVLFATAYFLKPGSITNAHPGSLLDPFFFSIETFATVGYGEMYPADAYSHWVAGLEIVVGMAFTAIVTGLIFVRFSKPRAKILYAEQPVVALHDGQPTLMIRFANGRMNVLSGAAIRLSALVRSVSTEGHVFRRAVDLNLTNSRLAIFAMTVTVMHVLDEQSPLSGLTPEQMIDDGMRLFLTVEAHDPALGVSVRDLQYYRADQIAFGMRYADAISRDDQGRTLADLRRISLLEPDV
jgi:inward rectifier potassium channel